MMPYLWLIYGLNGFTIGILLGSRLMAHGSRLMAHDSWLMAHDSWLMAHGSWPIKKLAAKNEPIRPLIRRK